MAQVIEAGAEEEPHHGSVLFWRGLGGAARLQHVLTCELVTLPAGEWSVHYSTEGYAYLHEATGKETLWASSLLGSAVYRASGGRLYTQAPGTDPAYLDELQTKNTQIAYSFRAPGYDKPFACRVVKVAVPLDVSQLGWEVFHLCEQLDIGGYFGGRKALTDKWESWLALVVSRCGLPPSHMAKGIATMRGAARRSEQVCNLKINFQTPYHKNISLFVKKTF